MPEEAQTLVRELFMRFDDHLKDVMEKYAVKEWYRKLSFDKHGTTNVIALDQDNNLAVGVSTSGLAMKFPGRVGDSPVFGAGIYCSEKVGTACTGTGELAIRLSTARLIVDRYERELSLEESTKSGILDLTKIKEEGVLHIIAMNNEGYCSAYTNKDGLFHYYADSNMEEPEKRQSNFIDLNKK
jgi:isoaspartyl peptidase/L-asparaginase-like protein (Ntn-hydrolase superfamily)